MRTLGRFLLLSLLNFNLWAQSPLPVDADTIGMFNFDSDSGSIVIDSADDPASCTASSTLLEPIPGIDASFANARRFGTFDSFVSCGQAQGSKFDFTGSETVTVEAVIYLENPANGYHVIFDNAQIQFMVVDNKLAGFVKQQDGFVGTISEMNLNQNQAYRVAYLIDQQRLTLFVDGQAVSALGFNEPIAPPAFSSLNTHIGGNIFGQYLPGYVDDVRVSSMARLDGIKPSILVNAPAIGVPIFEARPNVDITLSDNVAIDVASVRVELNDVVQTGLTVTNSQITGTFDQDLSSTRINILKVEVKDTTGNTEIRTFDIIYAPNVGGYEYEPDADTLALYHMNDFSRGTLLDASINSRHAFTSLNNEFYALPADGVFGNGRAIAPQADLVASSMTLNQQAFTFEGWFRPQADTSNSVLISTGQFKVERFLSGNIRISIISKQTTYVYETPTALLPVNELHHLAITWNGEESEGNLRIYRDGVIALSFDAISRCDFDLRPSLVQLFSNYNGLVDEVRVSSVARVAFNVPTIKEPGIHFNNLSNNSSTTNANPELNVELNSFAGIDPSDVKVFLNSIDVTNSAGLVISATSVTGKMDAEMQPGLNAVEVRYIDADGNHARKISNVFYIENLGGRRNTPSVDVALLMNFDDGSVRDISASNLDLAYDSEGITSGAISNGLSTNTNISSGVASIYNPSSQLNLGKRAVTVEALYRSSGTPTNNFTIISLMNNGFNISITANATSGAVNISGSTPVGSFNGTATDAMNYDGQWHHVAFVIDDSRDYSNIALFVDGVIKYVGDFNCTCDFADNFNFSTSISKNVTIDEYVVTREAKYSFNLNGASKPVAIAMAPEAGGTVTTASTSVSYTLSDPDGMNTDVQLKINDVLQEDLTVTATGLNVELSGVVSGLNPGSNQFELSYRDLLNNEQVQYFSVYYFQQLSAGEYVTDSNTFILYHMNEVTPGLIADSSGNSRDGSWSGGTFNQTGLFGSSAIQGGYMWQQLPGLFGLSSYTVEMWWKPESVSPYSYDLFRIGNLGLRIDNGDLSIFNTVSKIATVSNFRTDGQSDWVHLAMVVAGEDAYILVDGIVIRHYKAPNNELILNSDIFSMFYFNSSNNMIDEVRISTIPRFQLVSSQAK